ncbi:MAG TPA: ATP-binding cassette domain-containing protein [Candidatus Bathyarchaeota archaeon]|nr:ATP-binding cassette domain-containing protein [Candidatus Bathyarchaeota archaeon]
MEHAIEVKDLTKNYGEITAVNHINFEVRKGEIFGFLGPNGAGKTTTIRILTGVIKPDGGSATIMGYNIFKETLKAKQIISVVPEMANAYIDLTAWQNLMFIGELYGVPKKKRQERARRLLKEFGLYERRNHLARGFSKGMKQKLILGMALLTEPQVLFLDEPTTGLDVESARRIRDTIRQRNRDGTTIFLSTHNMEEASQLCDRIAIINHGKIAAIDNPENLRMKSSGLKSVEVSFNKPVSTNELSKIPSVTEAKKVGDKIRLYTDEPHSVINSLIDYTRSKGLTVISLNTLAPTLEDVFIKLIKEHKGD